MAAIPGYMKALLFAILLLCSPQRKAAQVNDLAGDGVRGRVKTITETQYLDEGMRRPFMKTIDKYDMRGNLTEELHNDIMLRLNFRKYFKYDTNSEGNVVKRSEFNDSGKLVRATEYLYDSLARPAKTLVHSNFDGGDVIRTTIYYYDSIGNKVKEEIFTGGDLLYRTEHVYDSRGRVSGTRSYNKAGKVAMEFDYNYLAGDEWVHCEKHIEGVRTHVFRTLDTLGWLIEKTTYTGDYSKQTIESYGSFDKYGNWLRESIKGNVTENYFVARTIEYYR